MPEKPAKLFSACAGKIFENRSLFRTQQILEIEFFSPFSQGKSARIFPYRFSILCREIFENRSLWYIVPGKSAKLNSNSCQGKSAKYYSSRTCFEKTAMSSLNDSEEQTSPPAMPGSRGVQVASSHFSKISASRGKSGCLKNRIIFELRSLKVGIGSLKIDFSTVGFLKIDGRVSEKYRL